MTGTYELSWVHGMDDGEDAYAERAYPAAVRPHRGHAVPKTSCNLARPPAGHRLTATRSLSACPARAHRRCPAAHQLPSRVTSRRRLPLLASPRRGRDTLRCTGFRRSVYLRGRPARHPARPGRWRTHGAPAPGAARTHTKPCRAGWLQSSRPPLSTGATSPC
jgi:hypothetical protein